MNRQNLNKKSGMALLIAVIASSALLLASIAISDIAFKQQLISYSGKESKIAFYAADAGLECALYHDLKVDDFFPTPLTNPSPPNVNLNCDENAIVAVVSGDTPRITRFAYNFSDGRSCAIVDVEKDLDGSVTTKITSRGYNNSCDTATFEVNEHPRNVERALEVTY